MNLLGLASSPTDGSKALAMAQLVRIAQDVAKKRTYSPILLLKISCCCCCPQREESLTMNHTSFLIIGAGPYSIAAAYAKYLGVDVIIVGKPLARTMKRPAYWSNKDLDKSGVTRVAIHFAANFRSLT